MCLVMSMHIPVFSDMRLLHYCEFPEGGVCTCAVLIRMEDGYLLAYNADIDAIAGCRVAYIMVQLESELQNFSR